MTKYFIDPVDRSVSAIYQDDRIEFKDESLLVELNASGVTIPRAHWKEFNGRCYLYPTDEPTLFARAFMLFERSLQLEGYVWADHPPSR